MAALDETIGRSVRIQAWLTVAFYAGLVVVLLTVLFAPSALQLAGPLGARLARNSEGLTLAVLLAAWIQFARPRLADSPWRWPVTFAVAGGLVTTAALLLQSDLPSRFRTLNETCVALAVLCASTQLRRLVPAWIAAGFALLVLASIVLGSQTALLTGQAESFAVLVLAPIGLYVVDRGILDPQASTSTVLRYAWYAFLLLAPVVVTILEYGIGIGGPAGDATRYAVRTTEAFVGVLLFELYFAVALGRTGRRSSRPE
jgi:hypothetical protein